MDTIQLLKQIQADSMVFYTKCFNLHWNINGPMFIPIHKYLGKLYDEFQEIFDYTAEKLVQLKYKPYVTMIEMLNASKLTEENNNTFTTTEALTIVLKDLQYFEMIFKALSEVADNKHHRAISDYANGKVDSIQKHIWIVSAQVNGVII